MQNVEPVMFNILWMEFNVSKLVMMLVVTVFGFILGVIIARPRRKMVVESVVTDIPFEVTKAENDDYLDTQQRRPLSDEDREYLS